MTNPFTPTLEIIRARNVIFYPFDKTDAQLLDAANLLLKHSDNPKDHAQAKEVKQEVRRNALALQGLDPRTQHLTSPNTVYVFWGACALIFGTVGYIIGAVTQ